MKESLIRILLFDFFDGKTTTIQRKLIEEWLSDQNNQEIYYRYLDEWESTHPQFLPDVNLAMQYFKSMVNGTSQEYAPPMQETVSLRKSGWSNWLLTVAAASIVIIACIFHKTIFYQSLESAIGKTATYRLSEGTEVLLNSNSVLMVPRFGFCGSSREVFLHGEAEFKVTHTIHNNRFIVKMDDGYQIEVLGTEFIAFSRARGKRVFLKNGKVKLKLPEGKQLYMKPGNLFVSDQKGAFNVTQQADPRPIVAWKERTFYFDNTLLSDVALQIHEQFDLNVRITDPSLANRRIAGIYKASQADDLLQILSELMQIEIIQKEDYIELSIPKLP